MGFSLGAGAPPPTEYLFVDGGALRGYVENLSARFFGAQTFDLDFRYIEGGFTKVFYYDAIPTRRPDETEADYSTRISPQTNLHTRLIATERIHVYEGDARKRRKAGGLEQKMVDVMLAVDMLTHTFRKNMQRATLLTGDQDFKPLIDALVGEGMFVTLWYPAGETNAELLAAADRRRPLKLGEVASLLTEESRLRFTLPSEHQANAGSLPGDPLSDWIHAGRHYSLYRVDGDWIIAHDTTMQLRHLLRHPSGKLLCAFANESMIEVPEDVRNIIATG